MSTAAQSATRRPEGGTAGVRALRPHNAAGLPPRRVLIVDDHPIVRQGLLRILQDQNDLIVCGEAGTASDASTAIRQLNPDVLICDIDQARTDSISLLRSARAHHPRLPILVLSTQDESVYAERVLAIGASGYITKQATSEELLASLRRVLDGDIYVSDTVRNSMLHRYAGAGSHTPADPVDRLSGRELQVLGLIGQGMSTRETAHFLNLSIKTVESHRQRIKQKLNLKTAVQLLRYAVLARPFPGQSAG
ncbi:MAG TPA: response regulator transcription factor [Steroidobacteraceae bacterium]|nr:response regulator transcription factor [Steroidobacteraceae bacterium]